MAGAWTVGHESKCCLVIGNHPFIADSLGRVSGLPGRQAPFAPGMAATFSSLYLHLPMRSTSALQRTII